jgi:hypothetical protein
LSTDITPLSADRLQELAYELALGYHPPDELAARFQLPEHLLRSIADEPRFKAIVVEQRRQIDETGDETRLVARKLVSQLVPVVASMVANDMVDAKDRIAAFKVLKEVAGITDTSGGGGGGFAIQINLGVH